jgi:hypothetical protein
MTSLRTGRAANRSREALVGDDGAFRVRNVGIVRPGEGAAIWVDHVWEARPREDGHPDEGTVGLMIEAGGEQLGVFLGPEEGLMLADRIRRAVDLVLEASEEQSDTDREYQLLSRPRPGDDEDG